MKIVVKAAMAISLIYYAGLLSYAWIGQMAGLHNDIWEIYDFPTQPGSPPFWTLLAGAVISVVGLSCLGLAYAAIWRILDGGREQDFRDLAKRLRRVGIGLIGFWLGYNLLSGAVQHLIVIGVKDTSDFDFGWDPLDLDIVFFILGIAMMAISQTLERAWEAEEENRQFI